MKPSSASLRELVARASRTLGDAGVATPEVDARLLADVYLAMTAGQGTLDLMRAPDAVQLLDVAGSEIRIVRRVLSEAELAEHAEYLKTLEKRAGKPTLWQALGL